MTDRPHHLPVKQPDVSMASPATSSNAEKLEALANLPARLSDQQLARVQALANAPLQHLPAITRDAFDDAVMMILSLPRKTSGELEGMIQVESYYLVLNHLPVQQIDWMVTEVVRTCEWAPPPAKCLTIAAEWQRADDPVQARRLAAAAAHREVLARSDELAAARKRLDWSVVSQDEIDAMPEWLQAGLVRSGSLRRCECGSCAPGRRQRAAGSAPAGDPQDAVDGMMAKWRSHRDEAA